MAVRLVDAKQVAGLLPELCEEHDHIWVAAAWGSNGPVADCLIRNAAKFRKVIFGVSFCQSDPDLIDRLVGVENAYVADADSQVIFHPKLYCFETGDRFEAIIGSSNLTAGGLSRNHEANLHIRGKGRAIVYRDIQLTLQRYALHARAVTQALAQAYRLQALAARKCPTPRHPLLPSEGNQRSNSEGWLNADFVKMGWAEFAAAVRHERGHTFEDRLALLRKVRTMFAGVASMADMPSEEWKAVGGVIGQKDKGAAGLGDYEWAWFGSMRGAGEYAKLIGARNKLLSEALDSIPRHGEVTQSHYRVFCSTFREAFAGASRSGGVATATRLLAMKRPDAFVCVSSPNLNAIANGLGFSKSSLDLENYWKRVIEPIRISNWFNAPKPTGIEGELWEGRVAMLDALCYRP